MNKIENFIDLILLKYQIYPHLKGYELIKEIILEDKTISRMKLTDIYEQKAKELGTSISSIERNIRTAFKSSNLKNVTNKKGLAILQVEYRRGK